jgi:hypothetical protein
VPDDIRYLPVADGSYRHLRPRNPGEHDEPMPGVQANRFTAFESKLDTIALELAAFKLKVVTDIADLKSDIADFKTSVGADMADLKMGVGADIAGLKTGVGADIAGLKSDIAEIRGRLTNMPTTFQVLTWFIGVAIGLTALVFTIARVVR